MRGGDGDGYAKRTGRKRKGGKGGQKEARRKGRNETNPSGADRNLGYRGKERKEGFSFPAPLPPDSTESAGGRKKKNRKIAVGFFSLFRPKGSDLMVSLLAGARAREVPVYERLLAFVDWLKQI